MTTVNPPASWYPDPADPHRMRYWDGEAWTPHVADPPATGPPAGWYPDPAGHHAARYWDGHAWTDQVHDEGAPTDPRGAGSPPSPATYAAETAADPASRLGRGTLQLRAMAAQGPPPPPSTPAVEPDRETSALLRPGRGSLRRGPGLATLATVVALVAVVGSVFVFLGASSPPSHRSTTRSGARYEGDGFTVDVPDSWEAQPVAESAPIDAGYSVVGIEPLAAAIAHQNVRPDTFPDAAARDQYFATQAQLLAASFGEGGSVVEQTSTTINGHQVQVITVDVSLPNGTFGRISEYIVIGRQRAVGIALAGAQAGVQLRSDDLVRAATSVTFSDDG